MSHPRTRSSGLLEFTTGSDSQVALDGGYLYVHQGEKLLHIAVIPSPNLLGERYIDTATINLDHFVDEVGNEYEINISSSATGIDWELLAFPDDILILEQIRYKVRLNEY